MKRSDRLVHVRREFDSRERDAARRASQASQLLEAARQRHAELLRYREDYLREYALRAARGLGAMAVRDYQAFVARLDEALHQQALAITRAEATFAFEQQHWRDALTQVKAVDSVAERWRSEETRELDRREQRESDERVRQRVAREASR